MQSRGGTFLPARLALRQHFYDDWSRLMKSGTFSVITPNYNMDSYLAATIESVLSNLRPGDEYFIVDGGSSDRSVEVIQRYESKISGWISQKDKGYADALAKGFARCTGEYLCWVNSGDLLLRGALDVARSVFEKTEADFIMGDDLYIDDRDIVLSQSRGGILAFKYMMLFGRWTPLQDACYWKRSLYEAAGGIDPTLRYAADYDFFLRAAWHGRTTYTPTVYSAFRRHAGQKSIAGSLEYKREQKGIQVRMTKIIDIRPFIVMIVKPLCWFHVRWRYYVAQRFFRTWVKPGSSALAMNAVESQ